MPPPPVIVDLSPIVDSNIVGEVDELFPPKAGLGAGVATIGATLSIQNSLDKSDCRLCSMASAPSAEDKRNIKMRNTTPLP